METLYKKLVKYAETDYYPFHMPGHKRNTAFEKMMKEGSCGQDLRLPSFGAENSSLLWNSYGMDITEIEGFDNLHQAEGILADAMERAARVCGAGKTYFLVNGSTCGLLAGISACVQHGDEIIAARNCHKAVYHAIELNELVPHYIYPQKVQNYGICGGISSEKLRELLITYPDTKLVVITSPTYEGIVSDIQALADTAHEFGVPLLVDEAHGAHFGKSEFFPKSALSYGADIVIQSMHKTMPAFTQTAVLHLGTETMADRERIEKYLSIYQTSSPSYLFMASIDWCMDFLEKKPEQVFLRYEKRLKEFYQRMASLKALEIFCPVLLEEAKEDSRADISYLEQTREDSRAEVSYLEQTREDTKTEISHLSQTKEDNRVEADYSAQQVENEKKGRRRIVKEEMSKWGIYDFDFSKINIFVKSDESGLTGSQLYDVLLNEYHLQMEMVSKDYVLAMTSICDTEEGMERLARALEEIDRRIGAEKKVEGTLSENISKIKSKEEQMAPKRTDFIQKNPIRMTPYQAQFVKGVSVPLSESRGKIAKEYIYLYPPGIPLVVPGEEITFGLLDRIEEYQNAGLKVCGQREEGCIVVAEQLDAEIAKGMSDVENGKVYSAEEVKEELYRLYDI